MASMRDFIKGIATVLPEIPKPERKPSLNERFIWTAFALVAYLVMAVTPLCGGQNSAYRPVGTTCPLVANSSGRASTLCGDFAVDLEQAAD